MAGVGVVSLAGCLGGDGDGGGDGGSDGGGSSLEDIDVEGDTAADRAVNAASQVAEEQGIGQLSVIWSADVASNFTDELREQWASETGVEINTNTNPVEEHPSQMMNEAALDSDQYGVANAHPFQMPDFVEAGYTEQLNEYIETFEPEQDDILPPLNKFPQDYKGNTHMMNMAADVLSLYLRSSWMEEYADEYEDQYGYELAPPKTYEEYDQQIVFMDEVTEDGKHGAWMYLGGPFSHPVFLRRLIAKGVLPFDEDMHPNWNTDEGIEVMEDIQALLPHLHPDSPTGDFGVAYGDYAAGKIYAKISWPSVSKNNMNPEVSNIANPDKWEIARVPGEEVDGEMIRPAPFVPGQSLMINSHSESPLLGYLFAQWMQSPSISAEAVGVPSGALDVFRESQLENAEVMELYYGDAWEEWAEVFRWNVAHSFSEIQLLGSAEYNNAIQVAVNNVAEGVADPEDALEEAEKKAENITERHGRDSQAEQWSALLDGWGEELRGPLGL